MSEDVSGTDVSEPLGEPPVWGLPALDNDTLGSVIHAVLSQETTSVATMAMTCTSMLAGLQHALRTRKRQQLDMLLARLGWSADMMEDAEILHSTGQQIDDSELLLLCSLFFHAERGLWSCFKWGGGSGRVAPLLNHLNLGSNRIGDRGIVGLVEAATRAPRDLLEALMLSSNRIGDNGATALAHAIASRTVFPNLKLLAMGGNTNMSTVGEMMLREACQTSGVQVRGVGALRGAPIVRQPIAGSWVVRVAVDSADSTRSSVHQQQGQHEEQAFARGVRERALARGDPLIAAPPADYSTPR